MIKVDIALLTGREPKLNQRFVLTDVGGSAWRIYCPRSDAENGIKEPKQGMAMDRTSCHRLEASQFRVLLTVAAYVLMQELRKLAVGTEYECVQVQRLQLHLLRLGASVEQTARAVVPHLRRAAAAMGACLGIAAKRGAAQLGRRRRRLEGETADRLGPGKSGAVPVIWQSTLESRENGPRRAVNRLGRFNDRTTHALCN